MSDLMRTEGGLTPFQERLVEVAQDYVRAGRAPNTQRVYKGMLDAFDAWCADLGWASCPPTSTVVAFYAAFRAETSGWAWSSINVALAAIDYRQKMSGRERLRSSREVSEVCEGIRRTHGTLSKGALPLDVDLIRRMVEGCRGPHALRDRALLLLGFAGAFRRSELADLQRKDLSRVKEGYIALLRHSKTDQTGQGIVKGIPFGGRQITCPVRTLDDYLQERDAFTGSSEDAGPTLLRYSKKGPMASGITAQTVNIVVKEALERIGVDATDYSGHSLRAGFVTTAAKAGKRLDLIMRQTGHKNVETVMRYIRHVEIFNENPAEGLGL